MLSAGVHALARGARWTTVIAVAFAAPAPPGHADILYLTKEGEAHVVELQAALAPAPLRTMPFGGQKYFRGIVLEEKTAPRPDLPWNEPDGRPQLTVVAFGPRGESRSQAATLSELFFVVKPEMDTALDVRALLGDRDLTAGVALGGKAYFAMARRAVDPDRSLGLREEDADLPPDGEGVHEGALERHLLDPPLEDEKGAPVGDAARYGQRLMEVYGEARKTRAPTLHDPRRYPHAVRDSVLEYVAAIARDRRYRVGEPGIDRAVFGALVFWTELATAGEGTPLPFPRTRAEAVRLEGQIALETLIRLLEAVPGRLSPCDDPRLVALHAAYYAATTPGDRAAKKAEFDAILDAEDPAERESRGGTDREFLLDPSEHAAVALEVLRASRGTSRLADPFVTRLIDALLSFLAERTGPDPRRRDRIDLREPARRAAVRFVAGSGGSPEDPATGARAAAAARQAVHQALFDDTRSPAHAAARSILDAAGWGTEAEIRDLATRLLDLVSSDAIDVAHGRASDNTSREEFFLGRARRALVTLRAIAALATSKAEPERNGARIVLEYFSALRERRRQEKAQPSEELLLSLWDEKDDGSPR